MIEIKYVCSNGKEYNLVGDRMRPTSGYFHDYEWKPMTTDQEIGAYVYGFEKEPKTYQITLTFRGPLEERKAKMDELGFCALRATYEDQIQCTFSLHPSAGLYVQLDSRWNADLTVEPVCCVIAK